MHAICSEWFCVGMCSKGLWQCRTIAYDLSCAFCRAQGRASCARCERRVVPDVSERVVSNEAASLPNLGGWLCQKRAKAEFECYLYVIFSLLSSQMPNNKLSNAVYWNIMRIFARIFRQMPEVQAEMQYKLTDLLIFNF